MKQCIPVVLGFLLVASPLAARDLNRQNYLIGERAAGMGGAFVSLVGDASSSYYNPAGLGGLYKRGISLSASVYQYVIEDYKKILDLDMADGGNISADMNSSAFGTFPSSMVYLLPLDDNKAPEAFHHVLAFSVLVPDYDKLDAEIDKPMGDFAFELKGRFKNEDLTYWAGPSYAVAIGGRLRLGLSVFMLAHQADNQSKLGLKATGDDGLGNPISIYTTASWERSALSITMLAQAGVQYDISDNLSLGLTVRSPTFGTFYSKVSMLALNAYYAEDLAGNPLVTTEDPGYADRIETEDAEMDYRLPLMIAAGASYRVPDSFAIALDVSFHLGMDAYQLFSGPGAYPEDPMGTEIIDENRALIPDEERQNTIVVNANLGAEINVTSDMFIRAGLFTDFTAIDQDYYNDTNIREDAIVLPRLQRFGTSLGFGMIGERSTTSFTLNYVYGIGDSFGLNELFGVISPPIDVSAHTITAILAGSADL